MINGNTGHEWHEWLLLASTWTSMATNGHITADLSTSSSHQFNGEVGTNGNETLAFGDAQHSQKSMALKGFGLTQLKMKGNFDGNVPNKTAEYGDDNSCSWPWQK